MGFFHKYPYTDLNELNLDWVINMIKSLINQVENFVSLNAIKYADPIQWSIVTQYQKNTVVIDPLTGIAYISVTDVPQGVLLTDTNYWTVVFDLSSFVVKTARNFTDHYEAETTTTATFNSAADDWIIWGDELYHVDIPITIGTVYTVGTNLTKFTLEDYIGHLANLVTADKSSVVAALNEVAQSIDTKLEALCLNIENYKTANNTYVDAFEAAYQDLPTHGGIIYIPNSITIDRSIDLYAMQSSYGIKKVMIRGNYGNLNNPSTDYNSIIIKNGDFDAVILANGCSMEHIGVSSTGGFTDNHDGIWVWGITCSLAYVGVNDQGGNGIRVGNKSGMTMRNCNIASFNTVRCVHNAGWGLFIEDSLKPTPNTSDANAGVYVALDIRDNASGGIYINNCIDNWFYSPDVEVNQGEAGIKIDNAGGIHIYSPYEENSTTYGIYLTSNSYRCMVMGSRCGTLDSTITNNGTGNYILGYLGSKFNEPYLSTPLAMTAIKMANSNSNGFFNLFVDGLDLKLRSAYMGNLRIEDIAGNLDYIYAKNVSETTARTDIVSSTDFTVTTQDGSYYRRKGNMCMVGFLGTPLSSGLVTIASLPDGFRPLEPIYSSVITQNGTVANIIIYANGDICVVGTPNEEVRFFTSFPIA